jgi:hypothetical protein
LNQKREGERSSSQRKYFKKEEGNSYKYEGMIAMTLKCNDVIDTY